MADYKTKDEATKTDGVAGEEYGIKASQTERNITNLYYDCLERIFDFLDVNSLLNVAGTCKRLQIGAANYFGEKFGNYQTHLVWIPTVNIGLHRDCNDYIISPNSKTSLALLRCFGNKISYLDIRTAKHANHLKEYIIQYCCEALKNICFTACRPMLPMQNYQKSFENIEVVRIWSKVLKEELTNVVHWFPNVKCLELTDISFDTDFRAVHFPQLEELAICFIGGISILAHDKKCVINLLHANSQLTDLTIIWGLTDFSPIIELISDNSSISQLMVAGSISEVDRADENAVQLKRLVEKHPSIVSLKLINYVFNVDDVIAFFRQNNSLRKIEFFVNKRLQHNDRIVSELNKEMKVEIFFRYLNYSSVKLSR